MSVPCKSGGDHPHPHHHGSATFPAPLPTTPTSRPRQVLEHMSVTQLIDIILINPTVTLTPSGRDTGFTASYTFAPLSNLVYTRDQQVGGAHRGSY